MVIFHSYVSLPEGIHSYPWLRARPDESIEAAAAAHRFPSSATPGLSSPSEDCRPKLNHVEPCWLDEFPRIQLYCILYFLSVYCFPGIYIYILYCILSVIYICCIQLILLLDSMIPSWILNIHLSIHRNIQKTHQIRILDPMQIRTRKTSGCRIIGRWARFVDLFQPYGDDAIFLARLE